MVINIDSNHPIFNTDEYQKDIVAFNLMEVIRQAPMLLASNEKNFVVGMIHESKPVWVWTSSDIDEKSLKDLCEYFREKFDDFATVRFVAKPDVANRLVEALDEFMEVIEERVEMCSYENPEVIPAKNAEALIEHPTKEDIAELAECFVDFEIDCSGRQPDVDELYKDALENYNDPNIFIIRDEDGHIAATASIRREAQRHTAISRVYTRPKYRGEGLASALVAHISKIILDRGKIPVIYTDKSNPFSNRAYTNVGFILKGRIDEVTLMTE